MTKHCLTIDTRTKFHGKIVQNDNLKSRREISAFKGWSEFYIQQLENILTRLQFMFEFIFNFSFYRKK